VLVLVRYATFMFTNLTVKKIWLIHFYKYLVGNIESSVHCENKLFIHCMLKIIHTEKVTQEPYVHSHWGIKVIYTLLGENHSRTKFLS